MNNLENIIDIKTKEFSFKLPYLNDISGLRCEIYYPIANTSHYQASSKFYYDSNPNQVRQLLILKNFQQVLEGRLMHDPFTSENCIALIDLEQNIPINAKVKVFKNSAFVEYFVNNDPKIIEGNDGIPLFKIINFIPYI